jgi:hypothetical protein
MDTVSIVVAGFSVVLAAVLFLTYVAFLDLPNKSVHAIGVAFAIMVVALIAIPLLQPDRAQGRHDPHRRTRRRLLLGAHDHSLRVQLSLAATGALLRRPHHLRHASHRHARHAGTALALDGPRAQRIQSRSAA